MCWWLKKTSNVDPPAVPTAKWVADVVTELPSVNSTSGQDIHYLCRPPSEPCSNASIKVTRNYCVNGVCCTSPGVAADEYCACFSANFYGDRCESSDEVITQYEDDSSATSWAIIAAAGVGVIILIIAIIIGLLIKYIYNKTRADRDTPDNASNRDIPLVACDRDRLPAEAPVPSSFPSLYPKLPHDEDANMFNQLQSSEGRVTGGSVSNLR